MYSILIVDDKKDIRVLLSRRLKKHYQLYFAENGKEAVEMTKNNSYDLVLMDLHMPVMDGDSSTRAIRKQGYNGLISALTASAMTEDLHLMIESGCDCCLTKPIERDFESLVANIISKGKNK